ncbi:hypothetical protein O6H91_05G090800 [Diphasiastrum complanatum]|uniref:Uncharacterized protein n=1 Tax=Diphasiastrum complanatum TaxID=34168 RepID=A0ACC2DR60_DIPCM|nr:hypothetical protein O6H91_05G090800 [Diphasiastrum complanatum]
MIYLALCQRSEDPAWWWTYSAVADSKAVTDLQCNPVLCCNGKGYTHSSSLEETHLAKTQHPFSLKQAASVLADMLAKPVSKATGAPDFVISKSNVCATEGQTIYSGSSLKDSHDITQQNEDPALGDTLNFSTGQSFPVHLASSEQYSQPEDLLAITSSCPSKCDFGILSDMMKAKLRSDSMKQEVSKTSSLFKTREMSGSPPGLMEDRPVMAGLHDNLPLLDMDREVGIGNEKHAVVHQRISNSGMLNVQRESAALSAFPCHKVDAVSENEIATSAARNFIADDKACTNADYGMPEEDSELRSTRLNNVQIEQGVSHIEDCFNKNQSVCESKNLEHGPFELRPFAGHVDPSNDSCKVKLSVFNCHNETVQGPQGSIPSSMSTKESHSDGTKTARCDLMNKNGFAPYRGSDVCTENPLPYSKQCHSPDHKAQYLTAESAEFSSFRLVNDSILNLSEVLLAHGRPNTCNAADSSDLRNLQLSIKNLSQYLLFEKGNFASQNCVSSSKLHGKQGSVQDESSSDGTNKVSHNQGKGEAINHSCENLYDYPFIETCLEPKVPKQRNPCDNWGNARRCHLGDPSHREIYDSEKTHKLMDAGLAMKGGGNGAAERKLEEISFHDLGAVYQKLGADSEAQLQRMKVLLDSVRRYTGKGDVAESNIVDISHSAHQQKLMETEFASKDEKVKANNRLGCLCETFPWDDLQNFDLGLRAEFEKLQALVGNFNRQLSHEQWKGTVNPRELNWLMKDHMRRTTKETQKAGTTMIQVLTIYIVCLFLQFTSSGLFMFWVKLITIVSILSL